jgi:hypothetical protein
MDDDLDLDAPPDKLLWQAEEVRARARATRDRFSWAEQQQVDNGRRPPIPVPLGAGAVDWEEAALTRKRAAARRELGNALEQSGLAERWRKTDQADAELKEYFASDGYRTGAIGRLMKLGGSK